MAHDPDRSLDSHHRILRRRFSAASTIPTPNIHAAALFIGSPGSAVHVASVFVMKNSPPLQLGQSTFPGSSYLLERRAVPHKMSGFDRFPVGALRRNSMQSGSASSSQL